MRAWFAYILYKYFRNWIFAHVEYRSLKYFKYKSTSFSLTNQPFSESRVDDLVGLTLLISYEWICVDLCHLFLWEDMSTMWHSLMIIPRRPGSTSWRARNLRRTCRGSKSSNLLWRTRQGGRYRLSNRITGVSIPPRSLMDIADRRAFGGSCQFHTLLRRMEW